MSRLLFPLHAVALLLGLVASSSGAGELFPPFWPVGESLQRTGYDYWRVWLTRFDVSKTPTSVYNLLERQAVLQMWTSELKRQGIPVEDVIPAPRLNRLAQLIKQDDTVAASLELDAIYRELEALVAGKEPARGVGTIAGKVIDDDGEPTQDVVVRLYGTPLGARTDSEGRFRIAGIPCTGPRYILWARKEGYVDGYAGGIAPQPGRTAEALLMLTKASGDIAYRHETLVVKLGRIVETKQVGEPPAMVDPAVVDMQRYPDTVKVYLKSSPNLNSDDPELRAQAQRILASVPENDRTRSTPIVRAAYDWVVRNVELDTVTNYPDDPTCGDWQITRGAWGRGLDDWCFSPATILVQKRATSLERERLMVALLRALGIPSRPAFADEGWVCQWWVQLPTGQGYWANVDTSAGREAFRQTGRVDPAPFVVGDELIAFYGITEYAPVPVAWTAQRPCLWLYDRGEEVRLGRSPDSLKAAEKILATYAEKGLLPRSVRKDALPRQRKGTLGYLVTTDGIVINLASLGEQRRLTVAFPVYVSNPYRATVQVKHWTNHPEWVETTRQENRQGEISGEALMWYCVDFELGVPHTTGTPPS